MENHIQKVLRLFAGFESTISCMGGERSIEESKGQRLLFKQVTGLTDLHQVHIWTELLFKHGLHDVYTYLSLQVQFWLYYLCPLQKLLLRNVMFIVPPYC